MTEIVLAKAANGALMPLDQQGIDYLSSMKLGAGVTVTVKRHNNPTFHRKLFALFNLAFESWEPAELEYKGEPVAKQFDQFRKDITVLAGFYDTSINFKGDVRLTAKSLNFSVMKQEERERVYSAVINVILAKILTKYTRSNLDSVIEQVLAFS